ASTSSSNADEEDSVSRDGASASTESTLSSAVGATLAQLLKRPEIVIEDLAEVVRNSYPEYFEEIACMPELNSVGVEQAFRPAAELEAPVALATEVPSGAEARRLSSAARNEMKTVETEIKYAGYLDQQRKSIERLKKAEQRAIPEWFDYTKVSGLSR